jgi:hypothetical protein
MHGCADAGMALALLMNMDAAMYAAASVRPERRPA